MPPNKFLSVVNISGIGNFGNYFFNYTAQLDQSLRQGGLFKLIVNS